MAIGDNIRRLRQQHGLTQKKLGEIAGVSDKAVSTWEQGLKAPRMGAVTKMATYFGIPNSAILDNETRDMTFAHTLDRLCNVWGCSAQKLERDLFLPTGRVLQLRQGDLPTDYERDVIHRYFDVPQTPTLQDDGNVIPFLFPTAPRRIPVLGRVPAGVPVEAVEEVVEMIDLDSSLANDGHDYFALLVTGDSMVPEYRDGDVVIIRVQATAETGDDVVAYIDGSDATLKRFTKTTSGIQLRPLNQAYPVRSFSAQEVAAQKVTLAGVVVELRRRRPR